MNHSVRWRERRGGVRSDEERWHVMKGEENVVATTSVPHEDQEERGEIHRGEMHRLRHGRI